MPETIHLLVTDEGDDGWSAQSPQLPGFVMGRQTVSELRADLPGALRFAGAPAGPVEVHTTRRFVTPEGGEYLIRVAEDRYRADRLEVAWRLARVMSTEQRHAMMSVLATPTGEVSIVCAVPSDTLGWFTEQLFDENDALVLAAAIGDQDVFTTQLTSETDRVGSSGWTTFEARGWTKATTLSEVMQSIQIGDPAELMLVASR
ncbi:hypothetical protein [Cryptosporangium phraense]|uniref:Uncharacterized protein n=1 Tax=Cryptosporangium phraense TaxID=2593070 RepID=A0A545ASL5_9ACTN|nr:hypothetical protein [Cryptosporangium phraense]TQS44319.1 hypothetical protein FL583_15415 [Cryptosporangium phraense]